jgi:type I site-specific restriction endonuclease
MKTRHQPSKLFGKPIHVYTRAQAIADGVLVDLSTATDDQGLRLCQRAGFELPVANQKAQIDAQAGTVLQSAADLRQAFADLAKRIEDRLQQVRQKESDNPRAVEAAAKALEGIKAACQRGERAVSPLRQLVLETHRQGQAIFAELECSIIETFIQAAQKAEEAIKRIPQPTAGPTPIS